MAAPKVDWEAVRLDYEAGVLSDRAIAKKYGISHTAVAKRAKAEGWTRNLKDRIRARAEQKVANAVVASKVAKPRSAETVATERQVIEVNAEVQAGIILRHRKDILDARNDVVRYREICRGLIEELAIRSLTEQQRMGVVDLILSVQGPNPDPKKVQEAVEMFMSSLDLGERATVARQLSAALATFVGSLESLIKLERQAFGIEGNEKPESEYEAGLKRLAAQQAASSPA